jgi:hypothetical protein
MPHIPSPDKTEVVEVVLRVAMTQEMIDIFERNGGLNTFFWEVFCMRQPVGKWKDQFQVVDVSSAEQIEK